MTSGGRAGGTQLRGGGLALSPQQGQPRGTDALYEAGWGHWGVQHSFTADVPWLTAAAEQGRVEAQARLGEFYTEGWGVRQDHALA
eukprot:CAMPEP_0177669126 /NCGR_PEP_ID=MMETSP0447-20121125/23244_1 /TAXON_ID=0 /ORGANISM="Stygamoeba regulata, Strain BSH-02190019" /LENGTH=85 /DNA_ID=CAMNT_0019175911 /DNA_START=52 /DNA_END=306 /DNA_ORIENTATION=+